MHVIFGAGVVGSAAARVLARRGERVRLVSRRRPAAVPEGVEHAAADVRDAARAAAVCEGAQVVYQVMNVPYHRWPEEFPGLQRAVVAAAGSAGARLVSFENVYAYGAPDGAPFAEDRPLAPCTKKGRVRAAMIEELETLHARGVLPVAHVRASDLFGPGMRDSALGDQVIGRAVGGRAPRIVGDPNAPHTWTYTEDSGETLARVGTDPAAFGQVWHVPSEPPRSANVLVEALSRALGRPLRVQRTPTWVLRAVGLFQPAAREVVEMLYEFDRPFVVGDAQTRRALGLSSTPFEDALAATVRWYQANGV